MDGDDSKLKEKLAAFGLSEKETESYLVLLAQGEATVRTVSENADVSQQAVYKIAERLEERGLVQVNSYASPTTIRPISPSTAMGRLSDEIDSITPLLEERFTQSRLETVEVKMIKSRETVIRRTKSAISQAEKEVLLAVPERFYSEVEHELRNAVDRGILVLLLIGDTGLSDIDASQIVGSADVVRCWDEEVPLLYVSDDETALIGDPGLVSGSHTDADAVEVVRSRLTGTVLSTFLGTFWPASTELLVTDPYPLPKTFSWFRQAVFHIALHENEGVDLRADIETSDGKVLSGPVTRVRQGLVNPMTNEFSLQMNLLLETEEGEVSIGGPDPFIEDYEGGYITLRQGK